jgi:hypothetical protein
MQGNLHGKRTQAWSQVHLQKKYIMLLEICSIFVIENCMDYDCSIWLVSLKKGTLQVNKWVSVFCFTLVFLIHYCSITKNFHNFHISNCISNEYVSLPHALKTATSLHMQYTFTCNWKFNITKSTYPHCEVYNTHPLKWKRL